MNGGGTVEVMLHLWVLPHGWPRDAILARCGACGGRPVCLGKGSSWASQRCAAAGGATFACLLLPRCSTTRPEIDWFILRTPYPSAPRSRWLLIRCMCPSTLASSTCDSCVRLKWRGRGSGSWHIALLVSFSWCSCVYSPRLGPRVRVCAPARLRSANLWGVAVTATADVNHEVVSPPWIVDLHRSVATVCGKMAGALCAGRVLCPGELAASWLACDLVSEGVPVSEETVFAASPILASLATLSQDMQMQCADVPTAPTDASGAVLAASFARSLVRSVLSQPAVCAG